MISPHPDWPIGLVGAPGPGVAHVWRVSLATSPEKLHALSVCLSVDELHRADKFAFDRDRTRYIIARSHLRHLLSCCLGCAPGSLSFTYGPFDKPYLSDSDAVGFNVAHSGEVALIAVAATLNLGVDIELMRPEVDVMRLGQQVCSGDELETLRNVPPEQLRQTFFGCWTRKEALLKAWGDGLQRPLDSFSVEIAPGERPRLLRNARDPMGREPWSLHALDPAPEYTAALALPGDGWSIRCFTSPPLPAN